MYGWMGTILHVDLNNSEITRLDTQLYAEKYLGGRGIGAAIYREKVRPETGAFDPENHLIFMTGPLVATGAQGATVLSVVGKSPATVPEGYCYGSFTGFVGAELKKAGFDGIVITGRAFRPTYLFVQDGQAELLDASALWGQNGYKTGELLQQTHGEKTRFIAIGVAGENRVRTAVALATHDCTLSAGFGAVFGSKNLKAIAVRGSGTVAVADRSKLTELNRYTIQIAKRLRLSMPPVLMASGHGDVLEVIGKGNCYLCGFECIAGIFRYGKRPDLVGHRKCQSIEYYMPWVYSQEQEPVETFFEAPVMANDYGFDSWELTSIIDWLYDCHQAGILTEGETGLPLSRIGTREFLEKLLHDIAYREGFGDILAEGLVRAGEKVSPEARALFRRTVAPIGHNYIFEPRANIIMSLLYPLEPRVHHLNYHDVGFVNGAWMVNQINPGSTEVTAETVRKIARAFWGSEAAGDFSSYQGKALAAKMVQNRAYGKDMLGLCDFGWPIIYSFSKPDRVGDPDLEANIFTAVTGVPGGEIDRCAERVYTLQRLVLLREGRQVPEADYPPEYHFTEPLESRGAEPILAPGPGETAVDMTGNKLDREKFKSMLQEFYRLRGWDEATGKPRQDTLYSLGISDPE